jgi:hypothetical protein
MGNFPKADCGKQKRGVGFHSPVRFDHSACNLPWTASLPLLPFPMPGAPNGAFSCAGNQVVEQADTRRSERRAVKAWEFKSPLGYLMTRVGECPAEFHKLRPPGATPGPATDWPGTQTGKAMRSRASCLWVRLPPRSRNPVVQGRAPGQSARNRE